MQVDLEWLMPLKFYQFSCFKEAFPGYNPVAIAYFAFSVMGIKISYDSPGK